MLSALEQSSFSLWLLGSNSIWAYPTVLTLHTFGMMVLVGAALMIDLRILGFARAVPIGSMTRLFKVMWWSFALNAFTGTMLFIADATKRGTSLFFGMKIALIAVGLYTVVKIQRDLEAATTGSGASAGDRRLAIISLFVWCAVITAGRLLAYV